MTLEEILIESRKYIKEIHAYMEAQHDEPLGEYYMDYSLYERMQKTQELIDAINNEIAKGDTL